jgi:ATP-dependent Clp protease, protease subunit
MDEHELDQTSLHPVSKEIWVNNFDELSAQKFRDHVLAKAEEDPRRPIVIYIDSYGGAADGLAKMIATMEEVPNPFVTVCMGKAMSAGAILLSCGDIRYCDRHSRVMVHEMVGGTGGNVHDMHADTAEVVRLNNHFIGLLAENCGIKGGYEGIRAVLKEHNSREIYMDAQTAKDFGLVDEVGIPAVVGVTIYQVVTVPRKEKQGADDLSHFMNQMAQDEKQSGTKNKDTKSQKKKARTKRAKN